MADQNIPSHILVRPAEINDVDAMTDVSIRSKQSNGYDDAFMDACRNELMITAAHLCQGEYWVAIDGEKIVGCASLCPDKDLRSGEVHSFFIDPDYQGQGVGRLIWSQLLERAQAYAMTDVRLDADPNAVLIYEAMGFQVVGDAPSGSIPGRRIPHMTLSLKP
jgi:ribosomal protein S18 acetylase RimI-like enzyme